jgi:hypothetical protein
LNRRESKGQKQKKLPGEKEGEADGGHGCGFSHAVCYHSAGLIDLLEPKDLEQKEKEKQAKEHAAAATKQLRMGILPILPCF